MGARTSITAPVKRLLTRSEAAAYCGLSPESFARVCPIPTINLSPDGRDDTRLHRYDVIQLDGWIDLLSGRIQSDPMRKDWLAEMDR